MTRSPSITKGKKSDFTQVYNVTIFDRRLTASAKVVYLALLSHVWLDKKKIHWIRH